MGDMVERLRSGARDEPRGSSSELLDLAADEIERLEARIAFLEVRCDRLEDEIWECVEANDR